MLRKDAHGVQRKGGFMLKRRAQRGITAILLVIAVGCLGGLLELGQGGEEELVPIRRVSVDYELGTKEITINEYIAGVLCGYGKWLDLDRENTEMIKLLAVLTRTNIIVAMNDAYTVSAGELPFTYVGTETLTKNYGTEAADKWNYIMDCIKITDMEVLGKDGSISACPWYEASEELKEEKDRGISLATAREMTRAGKSYQEVLKYFYKEKEILKMEN